MIQPLMPQAPNPKHPSHLTVVLNVKLSLVENASTAVAIVRNGVLDALCAEGRGFESPTEQK
jgi:hypothetical protein